MTKLLADIAPPRFNERDLAAARSVAVKGRIGAICRDADACELVTAAGAVDSGALAATTFMDPATGSATTTLAQNIQLLSR